MTIQAKRLKDSLRKAGIKEFNRVPRVRTERFVRSENGHRYTEYGSALATILRKNVSDEQLQKLRETDGVRLTILDQFIICES